jgi:hypothetical protein
LNDYLDYYKVKILWELVLAKREKSIKSILNIYESKLKDLQKVEIKSGYEM